MSKAKKTKKEKARPIEIDSYYRVMLKSSDKSPKYYSTRCNQSHTDADGSQTIVFGQTNAPQGFFAMHIPSKPIEECAPFAYCNFNQSEVDAGSPRLLTEAQYKYALANRTPKATTTTVQEHLTQ